MEIPFGDGNFDVLTICCVLHHLNNPQKFFEEARRVLKPGGILIVGDPWLPVIAKQITDWIISPLMKAGDNKLFTHSRLKKIFIRNNFSISHVYKKGVVQIIAGRNEK
jgi:ubiquinone/menaquinone biosynthesis C-methylase UbiE